MSSFDYMLVWLAYGGVAPRRILLRIDTSDLASIFLIPAV